MLRGGSPSLTSRVIDSKKQDSEREGRRAETSRMRWEGRDEGVLGVDKIPWGCWEVEDCGSANTPGDRHIWERVEEMGAVGFVVSWRRL
jgi:hypothetical protein